MPPSGDRRTHRKVLCELRRDGRVDETEVGVEVDRGVVTLTGTVDSYDKKLAAVDAAHRVLGVQDVADDIDVHLPGGLTWTDTEIAQTVRQTLEWDSEAMSRNVQCTVIHGRVKLDGEVPFLADSQYMAHLVKYLPGVRGVVNNLCVTDSTGSPYAIGMAIAGALERRAARQARHLRQDAELIEVTIEDGRASVTGPVHSWDEKNTVLGVVGHTPGVCAVEDHLSLDAPAEDGRRKMGDVPQPPCRMTDPELLRGEL